MEMAIPWQKSDTMGRVLEGLYSMEILQRVTIKIVFGFVLEGLYSMEICNLC